MASRCTPETVRRLSEELKRDPERRKHLVFDLCKRGFQEVVRDLFDLSDRQRHELRALSVDVEEMATRLCVMMLAHNGSIEFIDEGHEGTNIRFDFYVKNDGRSVEVGVRVTC